MCGIYQIRNIVNNKVYIGQTIRNFELRKTEHFSNLRHGTHGNFELQQDWDDFGEEKFIFEILEEIQEINHSLLDKLETDYIAKAKKDNMSYNIYFGGSCGAYKIGEKNKKYLTGSKASDATRKKMSESQKKYWENISSEKREEFKLAVKNNNVGKIRPPELRERISKTLQENPTARKYTDEQILEVRIRSEVLKQSNKTIGEIMNINSRYIGMLVNYERWKNLKPTKLQIKDFLEKINHTHDNPLPSPKGKV